jgi:hypothetical protein
MKRRKLLTYCYAQSGEENKPRTRFALLYGLPFGAEVREVEFLTKKEKQEHVVETRYLIEEFIALSAEYVPGGTNPTEEITSGLPVTRDAPEGPSRFRRSA